MSVTIENSKLKVQVWIYREGLFLLLKTRPGRGEFWQPVTGSVDPGEDLMAAALREAQEETGLTFFAPPLPLGQPFEFESRGQRVKEYGFSLALPSGEKPDVKLDPHEHMDYCWASAKDALEKVRFSSNADLLRILLVQLKGHLE